MPENKQPTPPDNLPVEEKKEFLKREEIRTMEKDTSLLRETEANLEREKIAKIKAAEIPVPPVSASAPTPVSVPTPAIAVQKPVQPQKSDSYKKILIRGGIVFLGLLILGFLSWNFILKKKPAETPPPPQTVETPKPEGIEDALSRLMKETYPDGNFTEIQINDARDLAEALQIEPPIEIFSKLEANPTLAVFSQKQGNRLTFSARTNDGPGLIKLLKAWELKVAKEGIFVGDKKFTGLSNSFKTASISGLPFRYLTLAANDLGICYLVYNDYFVLTTSFESMGKIIKNLTLENKVGQLFIAGFEGKTLTPELSQFLKKYKPGGLLLLSKNIESGEQTKKLISDVQAVSLKETGLPLFIAIDQEGGLINRADFLEEKTSQKDIANQLQAYQIGLKKGQELKELGINLNLAPVLDWTAAGDFLFDRSFQKPAETAGDFAKYLISGQNTAGILTAIKHFPGYSGISFNPEETLAETEETPEISQFKAAMESNPDIVMTANVIYKKINPSLPFTFSTEGILFLKTNLGENPLIISDDLSQNSLLKNFSLKEIVTKPIEAGADMMIFSGYRLPASQGLDEFLRSFAAGEISKEKTEEAVNRIIQLKKSLK